MAFSPRQFHQILDDMINFVRANTRLTDFSVGSVIRTTLEAAALEDDEQYFQMVQLLDAFSIRTASGADLDARVADYNLIRLQPSTSFGKVKIYNGNLITNLVAFDVSAGSTTIVLDSSIRFPTTGYPYSVRLGEGTTAVEEVSVTNNNTGTATLTVSALLNDHDIGDRASVVDGSSDITISSGVQVQVPATGDVAAVVFTTTETGIIVNGDYESTSISARSVLPGVGGNVGSGAITQFTSGGPFNGAIVSNETSFSGGRGIESDAALRDRALLSLQALSKGTPLALKDAALGVSDPVTGQRVATAQVFEDFTNDEVIVYVDDGTGFVPDSIVFASDSLDTDYTSPPTTTLSLYDASDFPSDGWLLISPESIQAEVIQYTSIDYTTNTIILASGTVNNHDLEDEVTLVEIISSSSESGLDFFSLDKWPVVRGSQRIWVGSSFSNLTAQVEDVDYYINKARGRIEFLSPLAAGSVVVASYSYYTGLIFQVQRFINGSSSDETAFPGVVAAGIEAVVETPIVSRINVRMSLTSADGFDVGDLAPQVKSIIEDYITQLGIGEDVIVSEIIERAMGVTGVYNVFVQEPATDISVSPSELPVPFSSSGSSLVTVN